MRGSIACLSLVAAVLAGCANSIAVPEPPAEVREIYVLDLGRHSRLAFGRSDGGVVEYAFGEWRWYALLEDAWWRIPAVMLWPTEGTLGRRRWPGPGGEARLRDAYGDGAVLELSADKGKAEALLARLDRAFERRSDRVVHNRRYGLDFVPLERGYWLFNNSNHAVREWLQAAGFDVKGSGMRASWKLVE